MIRFLLIQYLIYIFKIWGGKSKQIWPNRTKSPPIFFLECLSVQRPSAAINTFIMNWNDPFTSCKKLSDTDDSVIMDFHNWCDKCRCINISVKRFALLLGLVSRGKLFSCISTAGLVRGNSPSILKGVPAGGVVILKHQNSLWKTTIINDIRIKDHYIHNLLENSELIGFARNRFEITIELDGDSHDERLTIVFNGTIYIKKE